MFGPELGNLSVLTSDDHNPVFTATGDQHDQWREAAVSTTLSTGEKVGRVLEIITSRLPRDCQGLRRTGLKTCPCSNV